MTENIPQTSASDRTEAAREALAEYDQSQPNDYERAYADPLAAALRALITPPSVGESEHAMAARIANVYYPESRGTAYEAAARGIRAGIQAAHETWEAEGTLRPSQEQMLRWLGIEYETYGAHHIHIPEQDIEREEI